MTKREPKIVVSKNKRNKSIFTVKAANNRKIATSGEDFSSAAAAKKSCSKSKENHKESKSNNQKEIVNS